MLNTNKIYFPNLNGIRFIAALLVITCHIEQFKYVLNLQSNWISNPFFSLVGKLGVILFFVLSGFLITYLLLSENSIFKTVDIKKFYIRRIFRIWPLYFLVIILAFFILPQFQLFILPGLDKNILYEYLPQKLLLYIFFLPNLALSMYGAIPYAAPLWSIGTEEQFYILWPLLVKFFGKRILPMMFLIIFLYLFMGRIFTSRFSEFMPFRNIISSFWQLFNIDCMAIGGIFAVILFRKYYFLKYLMNNYLFYFSLLFTTLLIANAIRIPYFHYEFYSVLFGIIIVNFAANKSLKISLENRILNYLGSISYSIYMFHSICIVLTLTISKLLNITSNWFIYLLTLLLTLILSSLSFKYFEGFFLKQKNKYSKIVSGNIIK